MDTFVIEAGVVRKIALQLIAGANEKPKVEFKRFLDERGLAKLISAIANTDGDPSNNPLFKVDGLNEDYGMLILGVDDETGEIVGLPEQAPDWLRKGKSDAVGTQLNQKLGKWIRPVPHFGTFVFDEEDDERWIVVLIAPSLNQPHVFVKNNNEFRQGQWVVRHDKRTELPDYDDYVRVQTKPARRLESKIESLDSLLRRRLGAVERKLEEVVLTTENADAPKAPASEPEDDVITMVHEEALPRPVGVGSIGGALRTVVSPSEALRRRLASPPDPVAEQIERAFDDFMDRLAELELSWNYVPVDEDDLAKTISALEEATFEPIKSLSVLIANDPEGKYADLVRARLEDYALEHARSPVNVTFTHKASALHAYPGVLLENALAIVSHAHRNSHYLDALAEAQIRDYNDRPLPWVPEVRDQAVYASEWLNYLLPRRTCDPLSERAMTILLDDPGLIRSELPRFVRNTELLFTEAEIVLSLISLENSDGERAYFGRYVYTTASRRAACNLLTQEHAHLTDALRAPLKEALQGLWVYFSSLTGHTPCTREIAYGWPDCLEKPEST